MFRTAEKGSAEHVTDSRGALVWLASFASHAASPPFVGGEAKGFIHFSVLWGYSYHREISFLFCLFPGTSRCRRSPLAH
jgi:hypothetical protein